MLQMHDELDCGVNSEKQGLELGQIMREAVQTVVPMKIDLEYGLTWGTAKHTWEERTVS
jgi:DNA polymerase I-like protein with 3'-5' exonuclease and polymerase domains